MRIFEIIYAGLISTFLCACSLPGTIPPAPVLSMENPDAVYYVGEEISVELKGNASTGYAWIQSSPEQSQLKFVGKSYIPDSDRRLGGSGTFYFSYVAAKPGKCELEFEHRRPWENSILEKLSMRIEIREGRRR